MTRFVQMSMRFIGYKTYVMFLWFAETLTATFLSWWPGEIDRYRGQHWLIISTDRYISRALKLEHSIVQPSACYRLVTLLAVLGEENTDLIAFKIRDLAESWMMTPDLPDSLISCKMHLLPLFTLVSLSLSLCDIERVAEIHYVSRQYSRSTCRSRVRFFACFFRSHVSLQRAIWSRGQHPVHEGRLLLCCSLFSACAWKKLQLWNAAPSTDTC